MPATSERVRQAVSKIQGPRATDNDLPQFGPPLRRDRTTDSADSGSQSTKSEPNANVQFQADSGPQSTETEPDAIDQLLVTHSSNSAHSTSASESSGRQSSSSLPSVTVPIPAAAAKQRAKSFKAGDCAAKQKDSILSIEVVHQCPIFSGLGASAAAAIASKATTVLSEESLAVGKVVCQSGSDAREMYFVLSGEVQIRKGSEAEIANIKAGGFFGEIGVLFDGRRTADAVVSKGPCCLAVLTRADLESVIADFGCGDRVLECAQALLHVRQWFVTRLPLFKACLDEPGFLFEVAQALEVRNANSGEVLIRRGDEGCQMFFLFEGSVSITNRSGSGAAVQLSAPNFFGELALLYSEPRSATVTCRSSCRLYVLDQDRFHSILQEVPNAISIIYSTVQETANLKEYFIHKIPFFKSKAHDPEFIANIAVALQSNSFRPNEYIVRQNVASDGRMFAIAHGHAEVLKVKTAGGAAVSVANLKAGDFFGEVALLLDTPRVASVVARGHCHLYTLSRDAFETLAVVYVDWWHNLISEQGALLQQVKNTGVAIASTATTQTHGLKLPHVEGISISKMLTSVEPAAEQSNPVPDEKLCCVCRSSAKCMLSLPCSHIATCEQCHDMLRACPICRTPIDKGIKAFL